MFVELIESLRCPRAHEESQLIAAATRTEARHIIDGLLACPVCGTDFPIVAGEARFDADAHVPPPESPDAETAMRLAAFLQLTDARGFALLCGRWGAHADQIRRLSETPLVLVNPSREVVADVAGVIRVNDAIPFAAAVARAAALDVSMEGAMAESAVRSVVPGGRIVGPAALTLPAGVSELARDDQLWVGERTASPDPAPRLVALKRAR